MKPSEVENDDGLTHALFRVTMIVIAIPTLCCLGQECHSSSLHVTSHEVSQMNLDPVQKRHCASQHDPASQQASHLTQQEPLITRAAAHVVEGV